MGKEETTPDLKNHTVVSPREWLVARKELLKKEKEITRLQEDLNRQVRALPWVKVEKEYVFDTPKGKQTLSELFEGRSQLVVIHFMFGPGWKEGCPACSFGADHNDGIVVHLQHHDVSFVVVSRAPLPQIEPFKKRMGWHFKWVSSYGSDFNFDYNVSFKDDGSDVTYNYAPMKFVSEELPGISMFYKDEAGNIYHTYSAFARGMEQVGGVYGFLDHLPKGRNETGPRYDLNDWVRHHDKYDDIEPARCH